LLLASGRTELRGGRGCHQGQQEQQSVLLLLHFLHPLLLLLLLHQR
jgi:hypothetical protein